MLGAFYHGTDGLGDVPDPSAPGLDLLQKEHAVLAMIRIINERPGQVRGHHFKYIYKISTIPFSKYYPTFSFF